MTAFSTDSDILHFKEEKIEIVDDDVTSFDFAKKVISDCSLSNKDDPFFVMDVGHVLRHHHRWLKIMPNVKPFYAVKCNNHPVLLAILAHVGCGFDCASLKEIETILALGVNPDRIIYANPVKTPSFIRQAALKGVKRMTFDNEVELVKIKQLYPTAEMVLRIAAGDPTADCKLNQKFGCDPETAPVLLEQSAEMGIKIVGICFHVGSGAHNPDSYADAMRQARDLFDKGAKLGHDMKFLDIGGGFPGEDSETITIEQIADDVDGILTKFFPPDCGVEIIGEPGRFFASSAFLLSVNIIGRRDVTADKVTNTEADKNQKGYFYYINDGVYGSFNNTVFDHAQLDPVPVKVNLVEDKETYWSVIWGPTCDSLDRVIQKCKLPFLDVGDWLMFDKMGAYTLVASSEFNGFRKPHLYFTIRKHDAHLLHATLYRSLKRKEPHSNVPLPEVYKKRCLDDGSKTDDYFLVPNSFNEESKV